MEMALCVHGTDFVDIKHYSTHSELLLERVGNSNCFPVSLIYSQIPWSRTVNVWKQQFESPKNVAAKVIQ